ENTFRVQNEDNEKKAEIRRSSTVSPKVITGSLEAVSAATVKPQIGRVKIGAFDHSSGEAGQALGFSGSGEVVIGGLSAGTGGSNQFEPVGTVGPTDLFSASG